MHIIRFVSIRYVFELLLTRFEENLYMSFLIALRGDKKNSVVTKMSRRIIIQFFFSSATTGVEKNFRSKKVARKKKHGPLYRYSKRDALRSS